MKKFLWLLLLVLFAGFIFFNSSLPAETSYKASGLLAQWLDSLYAAIGDPMPVDRLEARLRKLAHFVEFAVLAMIMVNTFISWRVSNRVASGYILFLGLAVAVADEYIQLSVPGRTAQVTDVHYLAVPRNMAVEQKVAQQNIITKYVVNKKHRFYSGVFAYNYKF